MKKFFKGILSLLVLCVGLVFLMGFLLVGNEAVSWGKTKLISSTYCAFENKSKCIDELIARGHQAKRDADLAWAAEREIN